MNDIDLSEKDLETLEGQNIPEVVNGFFDCNNNDLTSLEFGPMEVTKGYYCNNNLFTSLKFCATKIGDNLFINDNSIENLKDIHKQFKNGYIEELLNLRRNPLKSHLLGVILIPRLTGVFIDDKKLSPIINNHLQSGRDVLECQEELIQNGFKEFAQL